MSEPSHDHLTRIVRLTLAPEKMGEFMEMFTAINSKIRSSKGCLHLELLQDTTYANIVTTYSIWEDESALNAYRNSELFGQVWSKTKTMFAAPPTAFSYKQIAIVA